MDVLSWEDFLLWLEHRYPKKTQTGRVQIHGTVILRQPGGLVVRVDLDGRPRPVRVPSASWQRFAVGAEVLLTEDGPGFAVLGRTASLDQPIPPDLPGGFVPPLFPSRESPQLPQPGHQPALSQDGRFIGLKVIGEESAGFDSGVLLDDGSVDPQDVRQIDHASRRYRRFTGGVALENQLETAGGRAVVFVPQEQIDAANHPDPPLGPRTQAIDLPFENVSYPDAESFRENFERSFIRQIPPLGRLLFGAGGVPRADRGQAVQYTRNATYQELPARTFAGSVLTFPPVAVGDQGDLPGQLVGLRVDASGGKTISGPFQIPENPGLDFYRYTTYTDQFDVGDDTQILTLAYRFSGEQCYDLFLVSSHLPNGPLTFTEFVGNGSGPPTRVTLGGSVAGVVVQAAEYLPTTSALSYYRTGQGGSGKAAYKDDPEATWFLSDAQRPVWAVDDRPPQPLPVQPAPEFTVRSPPFGPQRLSFRTLDLPGGGLRAWIGGAEIPGDWSSWTAYQEPDGRQTLLLADQAGVLVVPGLELAASVRVAWNRLLADLRQDAAAQPLGLGAHAGFHSFPEDRGYLQLALGFSQFWIAVGPWDAFRDVSSAEWRAAGLSKPRTRRAFQAGQGQQPPARIPPRPAHGLALWDVYAGGGGQAS